MHLDSDEEELEVEAEGDLSPLGLGFNRPNGIKSS